MKSETNTLKVAIIQNADPIKKYTSAIIGWQKVSRAYSYMKKNASGYGFGQSVQNIANSALNWPLKQRKECASQSPTPVGLVKVPLFVRLLLLNL